MISILLPAALGVLAFGDLGTTDAGDCSGPSPTAYYLAHDLHINRPVDEHSRDGVLNNDRRISLDNTIRHYSWSELECFSSEDDFTFYVMALSYLGVNSADRSVNVLGSLSIVIIDYLSKVTSDDICQDANRLTSEVLRPCPGVLPEAQFIIGLACRSGVPHQLCSQGYGRWFRASGANGYLLADLYAYSASK